jgi:hypothetical protein
LNDLNNEIRIYGLAQATLLPAVIGGLVRYYNGAVVQDGTTIKAIVARAQFINAVGDNVQFMLPINALDMVSLYTASGLTGYPTEAKVEDGTVYGPSSEFEGTLEPVTVNVTVDTNAIALAISTSLETSLPPLLAPPLATDLLTEISTSSDPLAERLRNASTVQSTGAQLQSLVIAP